jgi:hypothetical protein
LSSARGRRYRSRCSPGWSVASPTLLHPWGAEIHSCSSLVLAQETAEQIVSMYPAFASLMDRVRAGGWIRRSEPERPMRPMNVVMLDVDARHLLQVSASHDQ